MLPLVVASVFALVSHDRAYLRSEPKDAAARLATLYEGDVLEVRGEKLGYVSVYDHRRERGGYVRAWQLRRYAIGDEALPAELAAIVRFLKDSPGQESLGIGHAALYLKAAEAKAIDAQILDAIGTMADRLARRASRSSDELLAAHLDVAASYGLVFRSVDRGDKQVLCYDGQAFRQAMALGGSGEVMLHAATALMRAECVPIGSERERREFDELRVSLIERVPVEFLPDHLAARLHALSAGAHAALAFDRAREGKDEEARRLALTAIDALAKVDQRSLSDDDRGAYTESALRVGAMRVLAEDPRPPLPGLHLAVEDGKAIGDRCLRLRGPKGELRGEACTFALPVASTIRALPGGGSFAIAVLPLEGLRELWILRAGEGGALDVRVLSPSQEAPDLGYVELAGTSPDGAKLAVAREAREKAGFLRRFEIVDRETAVVEKSAGSPSALTPFHKWQQAEWKAGTIALR